MKDQIELEVIIQERLNEIKLVPERDPRIAARARAQFLAKAVSADEFQRHKGWTSIFRKEQFAMNMLLSILVIAGLLFGGGATVKAAQDDLPDEPLYALKTWSEDVSLKFQNNSEGKVNRLMDLARVRVQEMTQLIDSGQTPPDQVRLRLEQHIQQALQTCSNLEDAALDRTLLQLRDRLREQDRDMERLQLHATPDAQQILERTRTMLQQRLQLVDTGLLDPEAFRNTIRNGFHYGQTQTPPAQNSGQNGQATPQPGNNDNGNGPGPNTDPGGPNPIVTPGPDNSDNEQGPNSNDNTSNGNGPGENGSGGNEPGGDGPGGNGPRDDSSGGNGPGGNKP